MSGGQVELVRVSDLESLVAAARERFVALVGAALADRGSASVVLTGGGAGIGLLKALRGADLAWDKIDFYWGDERWVPAGHPERNDGQAFEALLDHVPADPARVFRMGAPGGGWATPEAAAEAYAEILPEGFDLHLLGMGEEGHINSVFPDTPAVREQAKPVLAVLDSPKPPPERITLTLPAIHRAREVWLLVSGAGKAAAAKAALGGAAPVDVPSSGAQGSERTVWFLDDAAAGELG
ncbi:6-phosphogluconolactonase [Segniliparus rugosus]|uniref:6-phosphogluconolactonase n=1 Tax=Segniliparus rugosus (strain ATCC BAA-974 / DSM 45345 / CCUG 50838 / CIP 108380 / JCM 13579 / CDC 945) TaxID=679197 RepID=E5XQW2_SEGRC|nr:6-phosphogluconolactonase [Segniliparus rugosus]EFV13253.1 6-phosphogluconolactonase [Segniliparus rugosus ATCC BAA-974]